MKKTPRVVVRLRDKTSPLPKEIESGLRRLYGGEQWMPTTWSYQVIAYAGGEKIGVFRFEKRYGELHACGTWILHQYRRQGIGKRMWALALRKKRPRGDIRVVTSTPAGRALVRSVQRTTSKHVREIYLGR